MKVLFQAYNTCFQNKSGGAQNRIIRTANALRNYNENVELSFFNLFESKVEDYDLLHVFRLDIENLGLIQVAKDKGVKVVLSTILNVNDGYKVDLYRTIINKLPIPTTYKKFFQILKLVDLIIVESKAEAMFLNKHYKVQLEKMVIIPNGVDELDYSGDEIFDAIQYRGKYVLQVGRFDKNKNQLNVIKAMQSINEHLVLIGGSDYSSNDYYCQCKEESKGNDRIHFLGWLDSDSRLLKSAFAHADILILPSFYETFGLVALEGAMAGAKLVLSNNLPLCENEIFNKCPKVTPENVESIRTGINSAIKMKLDPELKSNVMKYYSWEYVAKEHLRCYESLIV